MKRIRGRRGATMVEVVIGSGLLALLLTAIVSLSVSSSSTWARGTARLMSEDSASLALQELTADVRSGSTATVSYDGSALTVQTAASNSEGDYERTASGSSIRYYVTGGVLYRQVGTGTPGALARGISSLKFGVDGDRISAWVTSTQRAGTISTPITFSTVVSMRNPPVR
jgi:hypothetical protein